MVMFFLFVGFNEPSGFMWLAHIAITFADFGEIVMMWLTRPMKMRNQVMEHLGVNGIISISDIVFVFMLMLLSEFPMMVMSIPMMTFFGIIKSMAFWVTSQWPMCYPIRSFLPEFDPLTVTVPASWRFTLSWTAILFRTVTGTWFQI